MMSLDLELRLLSEIGFHKTHLWVSIELLQYFHMTTYLIIFWGILFWPEPGHRDKALGVDLSVTVLDGHGWRVVDTGWGEAGLLFLLQSNT